MYKKLDKFDFDFIINLGGYVDHSNKAKTLQSHYFGCKNLIDFYKKKKIKLFIQVSSSLEYGKIKAPHDEKSNCNPSATYGTAKSKATKYIINCDKKKKFPYVILRLYQIYGPNQSINRLIPIVISSCLRNKKFDCSSGIQKRDFLYIDDLTKLIKIILFKKKKVKGIFNVGSGKPVKVKTIIEKIKYKLKKGNPQFGKIKMRKDESLSYYPKLNKISKKISWKAQTSLEKGLRKTINFYK